ncbi:Retrovirus-related Pol polyprotein from transposon TNT 1-94 [Vitis vinifera]|uniref:Retrovirus-related Pol polyprotein from transposon TNT 1-94 n=1 Tax=Vitis vinifera TaxID=29760 RepID=A0A438FLN7_VITVI|nr:Retrovirus-related Pol polyprotein from transposon TNT 1-94 [Vitis vinifera]
MKDLGDASFVLGIQIHRDRSRGILGLSQRTYIDKVLQRYGMQNSKPGDTPVAKGDKFSLNQCPKNSLESQEMQKIPYASVVGSLMYAQSSLGIPTPTLLDAKTAEDPHQAIFICWLVEQFHGVPVHYVIESLKDQLRVVEYTRLLDESKATKEGDSQCAMCLNIIGDEHEGQATCPLCRSKILPAAADEHGRDEMIKNGGGPWRRERMIYLFGEDYVME